MEVNTPTARIRLINGSIIHIHVKVKLNFEMEHLKPIVKEISRLLKGKNYMFLYTAVKHVIPSQEVMEFLASKERSKVVIADAFVVNTLPQLIVARAYKKINKPRRPTRVFKNRTKAMGWLRTHYINSLSI